MKINRFYEGRQQMSGTTEARVSYERLSITTAADVMEAKIHKLEAEVLLLKQPFGALQEYLPIKTYSKFYDPTKNDSWAQFEKDHAADVANAEENDRRARENHAIVDRLVETINKTGLKKETSIWKRNKTVKQTADWVAMLKGALPSCPGGSLSLKQRMEEMSRKRAQHLEAVKSEQEKQERSRKAQERQRQQMVRVAEVALALGVDAATSDLGSLREVIRGRDKYLDLAVAGIETRNDWNDGAYRVEDALNRFKVETDEDKVIVAVWSDELSDFSDGRQFRDCNPSYDAVITMADPKLRELWGKLVEFAD